MIKVPRCGHGKILLGCPHDDCPEQNAYLATMRAAAEEYVRVQRYEAHRYVRGLLNLPVTPYEEFERPEVRA